MTKLISLLLAVFLFQQNAFAIDFFDKKSDEKKGDALIAGKPKRIELPGISCAAVPALTRAFLKTHVLDRDLNDEIVQHTADQFLKRLDGSKSLFNEEDASRVLTVTKKFLNTMRTPNCAEIDTLKQLMIDRSAQQLEYAKEVLSNPNYKLDENAEIIIDADKRKYVKDRKEAKERQLAQIHFQISNYLMTDMKLPEARKQLIHRYELGLKRTQELRQSDFYDFLVNSFAAALDPHSNYLSAEAMEDFQINMRLSLEGIGASLSSDDGYTVIQELIAGGAAAKSGLLQQKDKIIAVAQGKDGAAENVIDMDLRDVVKLIRGPAGSTVRLTILRAQKEVERVNVALIRSKVTLEEDAAKVEFFDRTVNGKKLKLARLELPSFYGDATLRERSCYHDMARAIEQINKAKADGVVLDLSQNGGGRLEEAVKIAGLFIKTGNIVATKDSRKEVQVLDDVDPKVQYSGPLVLSISRIAASASEIVAGALQDYKRAIIVGGDHTYGKGSVQAVLDLPNDFGAVKVTTGLFYLPSGNSTQHRGVQSDIPMPNIFSTSDIGEQFLDYSLKPDAIANFVSTTAGDGQLWKAVTKEEIETLRKSSADRVAKSKEFTEIQKDLKEALDKKVTIKLSDLRKKENESKKKDETKDHKKKSPKVLAKEKNMPQVNEAINILVDFVSLRKK